jgi:fatty acid desaturase
VAILFMEPAMTDASPSDPTVREKAARAYVKRLGSFYNLCAVAVLVIALSVVVNYVTSPGRWWAWWVVFGFAVAIAFSALDTFGRRRWFGRDWEERKVRELLDRDGR